MDDKICEGIMLKTDILKDWYIKGLIYCSNVLKDQGKGMREDDLKISKESAHLQLPERRVVYKIK